MNMADAIPALLILLLGMVLGIVGFIILLSVHLRRRNTLHLRPADFLPGGKVAKLSTQLYMHAECPRRARRAMGHPVVVSPHARVKLNHMSSRLQFRRR